MKVEEGEEGEVDENGVAISSKRVRHFKYFPIQMLFFCVTMDCDSSSTSLIQKRNCFRSGRLWASPQTEFVKSAPSPPLLYLLGHDHVIAYGVMIMLFDHI